MKKSAGFTLIEFIIVLGMVGVLFAIAIPVYKSRIAKNEALKVSTCEKVESQETPQEETLEDCLQDSDEDSLINETQDTSATSCH